MLSRGVYPVKLSLLDMLRVWAGITGVVLALGFFAALYLGVSAPMLPMLVASIGGFELFLFAQDTWLKRKNQNG